MPKINTQPYLILELIGISGEVNSDSIYMIHPSHVYTRKMLSMLKNEDLIKLHTGKNLRGYRLTLKGKKLLLNNSPERFATALSDAAETNRIKSEVTRRLRLQKIAEIYITMRNAHIPIFLDEKPLVFYPDSGGSAVVQPFSAVAQPRSAVVQPLSAVNSAFYSSREFKDIGGEMMKIKNARSVGVLLTRKDIFMIYNTAEFQMKWNVKSELRAKAILKHYLTQIRAMRQYDNTEIKAIVFGSDMEIAYKFLTNTSKNYFMLDSSFQNFYFFSLDSRGETLTKLISSEAKHKALNATLSTDLLPPNAKLLMENDALDKDGNPVLFNYFFDLPRLARFNTALEIHDRQGTVICFDYQKPVMEKYCGNKISFQTIDAGKFERRFFF